MLTGSLNLTLAYRRMSALLLLPFMLGACQNKSAEKKPEGGLESANRIPAELLENLSVELPHCTKSNEKVRIDYSRMKSGSVTDFGFPLSVCLNGLEEKTKNQISSLQLFVDLRFTSDLSTVVDRLSKESALVFRRQTIKTIIVNPKGEQGELDYALAPLVVFNFAKDTCKLRATQISLNMTDVKVKNLPVGPKWLPQVLTDSFATLGLNIVKFVDDASVTSHIIVPLLNNWLDENLSLLGCAGAPASAFIVTKNLKTNESQTSWYPPRVVATAAPLPNVKDSAGGADGKGAP